MKNNSVLTVSSPFRFRTLFTKPLKYIIQIFTWDPTEHAAGYYAGHVMNMSGDGFEKFTIRKWMKNYAISDAKIHIYEPISPFTKAQISKIKKYNKSCISLKYDALDAAFSALDEIKQIRSLDYKSKGLFCSQQVFNGFVAAGIFPKQKDKVSPAELKQILIKSGLFTKRRIK
ncbi:MAG: hypothetical protein ACJAY9_000765 [Flavobacteriales bacterium]|jgi:hypothetical protein